jgi:hypothetical protein
MEKIESLRGRIANLRDGLGDLKGATEESASAFGDYAGGLDNASAATQRLTATTLAQVAALRNARAAAAATPGGSQNLIPSLAGDEEESGFAQISGGTFTIRTSVGQTSGGRLYTYPSRGWSQTSAGWSRSPAGIA